MIYYDIIGVYETSKSKEFDICHYFINKGFKFQTNASNRCHDSLMMSMNLSDITILNIKGSDYPSIIRGIKISEAINLMPI